MRQGKQLGVAIAPSQSESNSSQLHLPPLRAPRLTRHVHKHVHRHVNARQQTALRSTSTSLLPLSSLPSLPFLSSLTFPNSSLVSLAEITFAFAFACISHFPLFLLAQPCAPAPSLFRRAASCRSTMSLPAAAGIRAACLRSHRRLSRPSRQSLGRPRPKSRSLPGRLARLVPRASAARRQVNKMTAEWARS